jgi:hypothetical protein
VSLTPSTAHLWTKCALSASVNRGTSAETPFAPTPDETISDARREGIAADWIANGVLNGDAASAEEFDGETAPNGWIITPDMVRHVQGYIDFCRSRGEVERAQVPINIPSLYIRGRADAQVVRSEAESRLVLEVIELKYGYQVVDAEWNAQLLCEAIALFDDKIYDHVIMWIYQPRPYHPEGKARKWELTAQELVTAYHWLAGKAHAALAPNPAGTPGAEWCGNCDGRGRCEALTRAVGSIFETVRGERMEKLDAAALGAQLTFAQKALKLVKAYESGVDAEVTGRMRRGEHIPGHMFDRGLKDREFNVPLSVIMEKTGITPFKLVPKSPAEMEREGADPEIINSLTHRPPAAPRLVPASPKTFAKLFK